MDQASRHIEKPELRFGPWRLLPAERQLLRNGQPVPLGGRAFDLLVLLVQRSGQVVAKDEIHERVWAGLVVEDNNLQVQVSTLRKLLGHEAIVTVAGRGYSFVLPLEDDASPAAVPAPAPVQGPKRRPWAAAALLGLVVAAAALWAVLRPAGNPAGTPARMPDRPSIAVLAAARAEGAAGRELAQGLADDLTAELARNADLRVVSQHSGVALAGRALAPPQIGARLGTRYFVDVAAQPLADRLLLRVQLVDATDGVVAWSARHELQAAEVPAVRDALVQRIAGHLHTTLRQNEESAVLARPPATLDVYTKVLRAVALKHQARPEATREGRRLLEQALAEDPGYAPAWLFLSMTNAHDAFFRITGEWGPARAAEITAQAERAIALDPRLPLAWLALSNGELLAGRPPQALAAARRCVELGPSDADCLQALATVQLLNGDTAAAKGALERALELSPLVPYWLNHTRAMVAWADGRPAEAVAAADECLRAAPLHVGCRLTRLHALAESGRADESRAEAQRVLAQLPRYSLRWAGEAYATPATAPLRARAVAAERGAGIPEAGS